MSSVAGNFADNGPIAPELEIGPNQSIRAAIFLRRSKLAEDARVDWVDYAKGFCIVLVVMMHSTLGVENALSSEGFVHPFVEFAKPFRMPDFFLISGLFLARTIERDWRLYLDRKVLHFAYFYVLWLTIQFAFKAPAIIAHSDGWTALRDYLTAFVEPFGTLWFVYILSVFFVTTKLLKGVPPLLLYVLAGALEVAHFHTGVLLIDEFAARYVFFLTGYIFSSEIFAFAAAVRSRAAQGFLGLLVWGVLNGLLVSVGYAQFPLVSFFLGLFGALAVISVAALLAEAKVFGVFRYFGRRSIAIYLAFFLPMALSRAVLVKTGVISDVGLVSMIVTCSGIMGALSIYHAAERLGWRWLFERPRMFRIAPIKIEQSLET
ncbi:acyltransferase family protein [Methylocystis iwaonis]|uniref:acyltransferase family protein n=1 Tax=Methylocystis iwaonis TaxID=2885079 RepID=UPI002E7BB24A|nr:acyltransferase family protein [Methylocystis iwaonis]